MAAWKNKWLHWCGPNASVCRIVSHNIDTLSVPCLEEVEYEKALDQLVVAIGELAMSELPSATDLIKFPHLLKSFYLLLTWTYRGCQCNFKYRTRVMGLNVFVSLHNVKLHALPGHVYATFYPSFRFRAPNTGLSRSNGISASVLV